MHARDHYRQEIQGLVAVTSLASTVLLSLRGLHPLQVFLSSSLKQLLPVLRGEHKQAADILIQTDPIKGQALPVCWCSCAASSEESSLLLSAAVDADTSAMPLTVVVHSLRVWQKG